MKKHICFLSLLLMAINPFVGAQVLVDTALSPSLMVQRIIGAIPYSNVQFLGDKNALGYFSDTASHLGLNDGVVFSTGFAKSINSNMYNPNFDQNNNGLINIPELDDYVSQNSYDGLILAFDIIPQTTLLSFNYIYASQEYELFACSEYYDPMAVFISGPNIVGEKNIAVVPGTNLPVSSNTINGIADPNPNDEFCISTFPQYYNSIQPQGLIFDGSTYVLEAQLEVVPCETYRIRIMIADGSDGIYDSALFIKLNDSSIVKTIRPTFSYLDNTAYEGCTPLNITFFNSDSLINDYVFHYTYSGSAQNGIDFTPALSDSVIIGAGTHKTEVSLNTIEDSIFEPTESVILTYQNACGIQSTTFLIEAKPPLVVTPNPIDTICSGQSVVELSSTIESGVSPFSYAWSNNTSNASSIYDIPLQSNTYELYVKDFCGSTDTIEYNVNYYPSPEAAQINFDAETSILRATNLNELNTYYWVFNELEKTPLTNASIPIYLTGSYSVYCENENGCYAYSDTFLFDQAAISPALYLIYPNPAKNELTVTLNEDGYMEVFGLDGRIHTRLPLSNGIQKVSVADLPLGMYIMRIHTPSGIESRKILITH